jgi:hypothetical protein
LVGKPELTSEFGSYKPCCCPIEMSLCAPDRNVSIDPSPYS